MGIGSIGSLAICLFYGVDNLRRRDPRLPGNDDDRINEQNPDENRREVREKRIYPVLRKAVKLTR